MDFGVAGADFGRGLGAGRRAAVGGGGAVFEFALAQFHPVGFDRAADRGGGLADRRDGPGGGVGDRHQRAVDLEVVFRAAQVDLAGGADGDQGAWAEGLGDERRPRATRGVDVEDAAGAGAFAAEQDVPVGRVHGELCGFLGVDDVAGDREDFVVEGAGRAAELVGVAAVVVADEERAGGGPGAGGELAGPFEAPAGCEGRADQVAVHGRVGGGVVFVDLLLFRGADVDVPCGVDGHPAGRDGTPFGEAEAAAAGQLAEVGAAGGEDVDRLHGAAPFCRVLGDVDVAVGGGAGIVDGDLVEVVGKDGGEAEAALGGCVGFAGGAVDEVGAERGEVGGRAVGVVAGDPVGARFDHQDVAAGLIDGYAGGGAEGRLRGRAEDFLEGVDQAGLGGSGDEGEGGERPGQGEQWAGRVPRRPCPSRPRVVSPLPSHPLRPLPWSLPVPVTCASLRGRWPRGFPLPRGPWPLLLFELRDQRVTGAHRHRAAERVAGAGAGAGRPGDLGRAFVQRHRHRDFF